MKNCLLLVVFAVLLNFGVSAYAADESKCTAFDSELGPTPCTNSAVVCSTFLLGKSIAYTELSYMLFKELNKDPKNDAIAKALSFSRERERICMEESLRAEK